MSYSMDSDANRDNATSPSIHLTMNEQLMYKLAALDAAVQGGFRRLDEKMDRFQTDLHDSQISTNDRISNLDKEFAAAIAAKRARIDGLVRDGEIGKRALEQRLIDLETWKHVAMAKISTIISAVALIWIVAAPTIRNFIGIANS